MNKSVNYIGSLGESFASGFYRSNIESTKRKSVFDLAQSNQYETKHDFSIYPNKPMYTNHTKSFEMYDNLLTQVMSKPKTVMYGFDLETFGSFDNAATELESKSAMISEFSISSMNTEFDYKTGKFKTGKVSEIINYTFGVNASQAEALESIIGMVETGQQLTKTEFASFQNLLRYGGTDIGKKGSEEFFGMKNGVYTINKHADIIDPYDVKQAIRGLRNMETIGKNQFFGKPKGDKLLSKINKTFGAIKSSGSNLISYNGINYDQPFMEKLFKTFNLPGMNEKIFEGVNHFDVLQVMKTANGFNTLDKAVELSNIHGTSIPSDHLGTLGSQSSIRGIAPDGALHKASTDIEVMLKSLFAGDTPMFNEMFEGMAQTKRMDLLTFDKSKVLFSNKSLPIGSSNSKYNTIGYGALDHYIENGVPNHGYSYSTNRAQYYQVDGFGFIPRADLDKGTIDMLGNESKGLYYLKLNNMAEGVNKQSLIFRENLDDYNKILQSNFSMYHYLPEDKIGTHDNTLVSQFEIDKRDDIVGEEAIRRNNDRIKSPKSYNAIDRVRKDVALYEYVKEQQANGSFIPELDTIESVVNSNEVIEKFDHLGVTKKDIDFFARTFNRAEDEYAYNKKVLNYIDTNINASALGIKDKRQDKIIKTLQSDAYNYITENIEERFVEEQLKEGNLPKKLSNLPEGLKKERLKDSFYGYTPYSPIESDLNTIEILSNRREALLQSNNARGLNELSNGVKYTSVDGGNVENLANKIRSVAKSSVSNSSASNADKLKVQKEYLEDLVRDFSKRGVLSDDYVKMMGDIDVNDMYAVTNSIAYNVNNVLELANEQLNKTELLELNSIKSNKPLNEYSNEAVARQYLGLKKQKNKTLDLSGRKINGESFSSSVENILASSGTNVDNLMEELVSEYKDRAPKNFSIRDSSEFTKNKGLMKWFKQLGYTDKNIETLTSALFSSSDPDNPAIANSKRGLAFHFYNKEINGVNVPFVAMSHEGTDVLGPLMRGEQLDNAATMMLPYVTNPNMNDIVGRVDSSSKNRVLKIGGVTKAITNKHKVYLKNGKIKLHEEDTVSEILGVFRLKKNEIIEMMDNKEFGRLSNRIGNYTQKLQLDEIGVSPRVSVYNPDGSLGYKHIPRLTDLDLSEMYISDDLLKYTPYLYEHAKEKGTNKVINSLVSSMEEDFAKDYEEGYLRKTMDKMKANIEANRNFAFSDVSPDVQEWVRRYTNKDDMYLKAIAEFTDMQGDTIGHNTISDLLERAHHSFTKDSRGTSFIINTGSGVKGNPGSHLTGISRPLLAQIRGAIPFLYDELGYETIQNKIKKALSVNNDNVVIKSNKSITDASEHIANAMEEYGVHFSPTIVTDSLMDDLHVLKNADYNVVTGITANLKQANVQHYLKNFNSIKSNQTDATELLNKLNKQIGGAFTKSEFDEVFDIFGNNFATYEQGGMLNPRMKFLFDKPQQFVEEVGEDFYNQIKTQLGESPNEPIRLIRGQELGYIDEQSKIKKFKGQQGIITSLEPLGGSTNKKFRIRYMHENSNLDGVVKLFAGYSEKGIFSIPDAGDRLNPLLYAIYDNFFGRDTLAVSSFELFKHQSFGALAFSEITTMFEGYSQAGDKYVNKFVSTLNDLLPQYDFGVVNNPQTGFKSLRYDHSPDLVGNHTMYNALTSLRSNLETSSDEVDIKVLNRIKTNEAEGIIRTEFNIAPLEEGFGQSVKYESKLEQQLASVADANMYDIFGDKAERVSEELNRHLRGDLTSSTGYANGYKMVQNMKSTVKTLQGEKAGIIKSISVDDINIPSTMADWREILDSTIFDFAQTNEHGASVNSFSIKIPGNANIKNPLDPRSTIDSIVLPLTKPYQEDSYMLSSIQKRIAGVVINVQDMEKANAIGDMEGFLASRKKLEAGYKTFVSSMYGELTDKDGMVNKLLKTSRLEKGSFSLTRKIIEPLLDEKGGFLDPFASNFYDLSGKTPRYLDNIEMSEDALKELGVYFDDVGKQIYENQDGYKNFLGDFGEKNLATIQQAEKDLELANRKLKSNLNKSTLVDVQMEVKKYENIINSTYKSIGTDFFTHEGVFSISHRYPLSREESVNVTKVFLNPKIKGNTFIMGPHTAHKLKLDTDGDQLAVILNGLFNKETGRLNIFKEDSYLNNISQTIHNARADGNEAIVNYLVGKRESGFNKSEFLSDHKPNKSYIEIYKDYLAEKSSGETVLDFDNYFNDKKSVDQALQTISAKTSIGYISNENYILRELSTYMYQNKEGLDKMRLIQQFTTKMEQNIFDSKHMSVEQYSMILAKPYKTALSDLRSGNPEQVEKGIASLSDISSRLGIFEGKEGKIDIENIINPIPFEDMTKGEQTIYAISNMLQDDEIQAIRKDPLFWKQSYKSEDEAIQVIKEIFDGEKLATNKGRVGREREIYQGLDDYQHLKIGELEVGRGAYIQNGEYSPYKINHLFKTNFGADVVELENIYGENYHLMGNTFEEISEQLLKDGFGVIDEPEILNAKMDIIDKMFASEDDFIRQMTYNKTLPRLSTNENVNDNENFNKNLNKAGEELNLNRQTIDEIKESLLKDGNSSMVKKYRNFYDDIFSASEDVFDETYNIIRTLNETNLFTEDEIMKKAKTFYDDTVLNLSENMNNDIRQQAINASKRKLYQDSIPSHVYSNFDEYINKYETSAQAHSPKFTNLSSNKPLSHVDYYNVDAPNKYNVESFDDLLKMGEAKININGNSASLNSLTAEDILRYATSKSGASKEVLASQEKARYYLLGKYNLSRKFGDALERDGDKLRIIDAVAGDMNDATREGAQKLSKETSDKVSAKFLKDSLGYIGDHKFMTAAMIAGAIGITSAIANNSITQPLEVNKKPNGSSPMPDGSYQDNGSRKKRRVAPSSENKAYLSHSGGKSYEISASNNGKSSVGNTIDKLKRLMSTNSTININQRQDTSKVSDSWIEDKISESF